MNIEVPTEVRAAAVRVIDQFNEADRHADACHRDWHENPTLGNAIQRDDSRQKAADLEDAALVAHFVVGINAVVTAE